jgi:hypothetical protein
MAGNVAAGVVAGDLNLAGDVLDNQVELRDLGGGNYQLVGLGGTTINGMASQVFGGVVGNINASLSRGDDTLLIDEAFATPGDLNIDMGGDDDQVLMYGTTTAPIDIKGSLSIRTGSGHDHVRLAGVRVLDNAIIDGGSENDAIVANQLFVGQTLGVLTRAGDDLVNLNRTSVLGATRIDTSDGNDVLSVGARSQFVGSFSAFMGNGNDKFRLGDSAFHDYFNFHAGEGQDRVDVYGKVRFQRPATFALGGGDDQAEVAATAFIDNASSVVWDGGFGFDSMLDAAGNYNQPALVSHFNFP